MAFDANGKVINISVNGIGVGSTMVCGQTIQLGDTATTVKSTCGNPNFINKQDATPGTMQTSDKVTTFTYNTNPPVKLIFKNGELTGQQ